MSATACPPSLARSALAAVGVYLLRYAWSELCGALACHGNAVGSKVPRISAAAAASRSLLMPSSGVPEPPHELQLQTLQHAPGPLPSAVVAALRPHGAWPTHHPISEPLWKQRGAWSPHQPGRFAAQRAALGALLLALWRRQRCPPTMHKPVLPTPLSFHTRARAVVDAAVLAAPRGAGIRPQAWPRAGRARVSGLLPSPAELRPHAHVQRALPATTRLPADAHAHAREHLLCASEPLVPAAHAAPPGHQRVLPRLPEPVPSLPLRLHCLALFRRLPPPRRLPPGRCPTGAQSSGPRHHSAQQRRSTATNRDHLRHLHHWHWQHLRPGAPSAASTAPCHASRPPSASDAACSAWPRPRSSAAPAACLGPAAGANHGACCPAAAAVLPPPGCYVRHQNAHPPAGP
mmetsp:Transcript_124608/g.363862  ORF Transcript_124608/g.363862 Transcript_124608/m.363862 type:complete len:404 (-) Transcript_124608:392-1603(-)